MATLLYNGVYERLVTPSAVGRTHLAGVERSRVGATHPYPTVAAAILKASPEGEGFNPPSVGQ
jgi:hypothetical protein